MEVLITLLLVGILLSVMVSAIANMLINAAIVGVRILLEKIYDRLEEKTEN